MPAADSWYHEKESAWLYGAVASAEPDPRNRELFLKLAEAAEEQAACWRRRDPSIADRYSPSLRARTVARLLRHFEPRHLRRVLAAMKLRGLSVYGGRHAPATHAMPTSASEVGGRHTSLGGNNLRAAVFGASDGLVSNASLVMGIAGAGMAPDTLLLTGMAGLLAGALSMGAGEYVSVRSQREFYEHQIALEREELAAYPDEEAEELALIYNARGLGMDEARDVSRKLLANPEHALDVLAREELGLNPDDLGSPLGAASSSFCCFAVGAAVPLLPFLFRGVDPIYAAAALTVCALFALGVLLSLFTGHSALRGGLRQVLIGGGAGLAAWSIGRMLGASVS
ncbi:MAG TPA: VIT1/CCC1 transporter family protein [Steroidobacteraceae bacterium]|nr:VIT1/CCC1 transporter family protein [Steroidobacteraceae bacterium]